MPACFKINLVIACARINRGVLPRDFNEVITCARVDGIGAFGNLNNIGTARAREICIGVEFENIGNLFARRDILLKEVIGNFVVEKIISFVEYDGAEIENKILVGQSRERFLVLSDLNGRISLPRVDIKDIPRRNV